jgi:cysteine desulfurase
LFIKSPLLPDPILFGGGHENERRAGTENLAAITGFVEALQRFVPTPVFNRAVLKPWGNRLIALVESIEGAVFVGSREKRLANTVSFVVNGSDSIALMAGLDLEGICASSGSACSAGSLEPSHVILGLGIEKALANSLVRFSLGRETTEADIAFAERMVPMVIKRTQRGQ